MFSLLVLLLPSTLAEAKGNSVLGVSTVYEDRATTVDISVFIQSDEAIAGGSFDVEYDSSIMTVADTDVKQGDLIAPTLYLTSTNGAEAGKVSMAFAKFSGGASLDGTILTFRARVTKAKETVDLQLKNVNFYNAQGGRIAIQALSGQVKPFTGKQEEHKDAVKGDKAWTIRLSNAYNPATLNEHTITVKRGATPFEIIIEPIDATSFKVKPKSNYARGTYTLEISEQLRSTGGSKLNQPVRHIFKVQ